jgi:hypothetical protein
MYFRARYYSGLLGRFIQADTIVPGAGNPQNLNRYAYVSNNPLKYIDPSGHDPCTGRSGTYMPDCGVDGRGLKPPKPPKDPIPLTPWGQKMEQLFAVYRDTPEWWNNNTPGQFTLEDFLALTMYIEYADTPLDAIGPFTEATSRKLWWWCKEVGCGGGTYAAILNYVGTRAVMRSRYSYVNDPATLAHYTAEQSRYHYTEAKAAAHQAIYPTDANWKSGAVGYHVPWDWGNPSMFPESSQGTMFQISDFGLTVNSVVYLRPAYDRVGNPTPPNAFVIVTFCQAGYWKSGAVPIGCGP